MLMVMPVFWLKVSASSGRMPASTGPMVLEILRLSAAWAGMEKGNRHSRQTRLAMRENFMLFLLMGLQPDGMPGLPSLPVTVPQKKLSDNTPVACRLMTGRDTGAFMYPFRLCRSGQLCPQAIHSCSFFAKSSLSLFRSRQLAYI